MCPYKVNINLKCINFNRKYSTTEKKKNPRVALTQISLTLHYNRRKIYLVISTAFVLKLYVLCFIVE